MRGLRVGLGPVIQRLLFLRFIPPRQILRRLYLRLNRTWWARTIRFMPMRVNVTPSLRKLTGLPGLHAPHGALRKTPNTTPESSRSDPRISEQWTAEFLGHTHRFEDGIDWGARSDDPRAQLWCMNLHYFEYLPDVTATEAGTVITDWIRHCCSRRPQISQPALRAAWTPYAASLRVSAWIDFWARCGPTGSPEFQSLFAAALYAHGPYISQNLETDIGGNHLIKNIRALTELGSSFEGQHGRSWRRLADRHLMAMIDSQILADGVHYERSASYHAQVFADLLTIAVLRPRDEIRAKLDTVLPRMAQALIDLTHPDGLPAQFNDAGLHMCVLAADCLKVYHGLYGDRPLPSHVITYPESGFYGLRTHIDYVIAKFGALGPDALMAHAHGDWGSFEWSHKGARIIVDPGIYEYMQGAKRAHARATSAHNTGRIAGAEQADFFGAFRCGARPNPAPPEVNYQGDRLSISGLLKPAGRQLGCGPRRVIHKRHLDITPTQIIISDAAEDPNQPVISGLLLHPDVKINRLANGIRLTHANGLDAYVYLNAGEDLEIKDAQWWPDMGYTLKTQRLVAHGIGHVEVRIDIAASP